MIRKRLVSYLPIICNVISSPKYKKKPKSNMTLETLNDYKFNLCVFIIIFIDYVTSMFNRLNQCQKPSPPNAV